MQVDNPSTIAPTPHKRMRVKLESVSPSKHRGKSNPEIPASPTANAKGKGKEKEGEFRVAHAEVTLSISPVFANDPRAGVEEMLDSMLMRYVVSIYI